MNNSSSSTKTLSGQLSLLGGAGKQRHREASGPMDDWWVRNLGSDYQEIEKRTLTRWVNAQLSAVGDRIERIETDFKDGKRLLKLLSVVSGQPAPKPERMNMRIHQLANVSQALSFLEKQVPEQLPDIGNEAIVNGDVKKTLALVFFIMLRYQVQVILTDHGDDYMASLSVSFLLHGNMKQKRLRMGIPKKLSERQDDVRIAGSRRNSIALQDGPPTLRPGAKKPMQSEKNSTASEAKLALLYWVRIQLEDYIAANLISSIQDFSRSWRNGLAFCLLIHRHDPILIPDLLTARIRLDLADKETWRQLLTLAFEVAEAQLKIPRYLDPEDLIDVEYPFEPSIMMYVGEYYKVMSRAQRAQSLAEKRDKAAKRRAAIAMAVGGDAWNGSSPEQEVATTIIEEEEEEEEEKRPVNGSTLESKVRQQQPPRPASRTRLEAPVPIPMPSARRHKQHRKSTLGEQDKARIKADLNSRLMMQLTGHLPRGVHPVLDQLITIHETMLSFIKTHTRTIDEIPEEFTRSATVREYIDALEIIEEQARDKAGLLKTAKEARDTLTQPPEAVQDESRVIPLTDVQRSQVAKLCDVLEKEEWKPFMELLQSTKADLRRVEADLVKTEKGVAEYEEQAAVVEKELSRLFDLVESLPPRLHPLDAYEADMEAYEKRVEDASAQLQAFDRTTWREFRSFYRRLFPNVLQLVAQRHASLERTSEKLDETMHWAKRQCSLFKRGMTFGQEVAMIEDALMDVQKAMDPSTQATTTTTTNEGIQELEDNVRAVRTKIHDIREAYFDLFDDDSAHKPGFTERLEKVEERYRVVRDWVDQVRVWFVEAERIREWINARIQIIADRDETDTVEPLLEGFAISEAEANRLYKEHDQLKREIEQFDADDMARLRAHVKQLTTATADKKLSPADTSTIEITLQTLSLLTRLKQLLQKRTVAIDMMMLRIKWEKWMAKAAEWIELTGRETTEFMYHKARWSSGDLDTEAVIDGLVSLEKKVAEFDQHEYASVLDAYQEMEDLGEQPLPEYLERRESAFERSFADLMRRTEFCRRAVEQCLAVADVMGQFKSLGAEGERLRQEMSLFDVDKCSEVFGEQVQALKEQSAYLMTEVVATKIPYPQVVPETEWREQDEAENSKAIERVKHAIEESGMALAVTVERLEELLAQHRENMSLQERVALIVDEMKRMTAWFEERIKTLHEKSQLPELVDIMEGQVEREEIDRLENERVGMMARIQQMDRGDYAKALERMRMVESEIDATNAVSVDHSMLISAAESMEQGHDQLVALLERRENQLKLCLDTLEWKSAWEKANRAIADAAADIWSFTVKKAVLDPAREDPLEVSCEGDAKHRQLMADYDAKVQGIKETQLEHVKRCYEAIKTTHSKLEDSVKLDGVASKQTELYQKHEELVCLLSYVAKALEQRTLIVQWVAQTEQVVKEGQELWDKLEKAQRRHIDLQDALDEQVMAFETRARAVMETSLDAAPEPTGFGERLQWDFDATEPNEYHTRVQAQTQTLVDARKDQVRQMLETVKQIYHAHQSSGRMKLLIKQYDTEVSELRRWVFDRMRTLKHQPLSTSSDMNEDDIHRLSEEHERFVADMNTFVQSNVCGLQNNVQQLLSHQQYQDMSRVERRLSEVMEDLERLRTMAAERAKVLDVLKERAAWEKEYTAAAAQLKELNEDLRATTKQMDGANPDTSELEPRIGVWEEALKAIGSRKEQWVAQELASTQAAFESWKQVLSSSGHSDTDMPVPIEAKTDALKRMQQRLDDTLKAKMQEVELVKERVAWEQSVSPVLKQLGELEGSLGHFLQSDARWHPEKAFAKDHGEALNIRCLELASCFDKLQSETCQASDETWQELNKRADGLGETSLVIVPESTRSIHRALCEAQKRIADRLKFAHAVVQQHCLISAFVARSTELEHTANAMREEFLSSSDVEAHRERLVQFEKDVENLQSSLVRQIQYPTRSVSATRVTTHVRVDDDSLNKTIMDTLLTRTERLSELVSGLKLVLESRETMSRCRMQMELYKQHAHACESWIQSRLEIIAKHDQLLQSACERILDQDELDEAASSARSIEQAIKISDNTFTCLETLFEQCVVAFDNTTSQDPALIETEEALANEFDAITATQSSLSDAWQRLRENAERVATSLCDLLEPSELLYRAKSLSSILEQLEHDIQSADPASVTDEQMVGWQKRMDKLDVTEYRPLQTDVAAYCNSQDGVVVAHAERLIEGVKNHLEVTGERMVEIRAALTGLYETVNASRLRKTYTENAAVARNMMARLRASFAETMETYKYITAETRATQRRGLAAMNRDIQHRMGDCQDVYDDLCGYRELFTLQKVDEDDNNNSTLEELHVQIQREWQELQDQLQQLSELVSRIGCWYERYDRLEKLYQDLVELQHDMEGGSTGKRRMMMMMMMPSMSITSSTATSSSLKSHKSDQEGYALSVMEKRLSAIMYDFEDLETKAWEDAKHDNDNASSFLEQCTRIANLGATIKGTLSNRKLEHEKSVLLAWLEAEIRRQCSVCEEQLAFLRQQAQANPTIAEKKPAAIQNVIQTYDAALASVRQTYTLCKDDLEEGGKVAEPCSRLINEMGCSPSDVDRMKRPLVKLISDIEQKVAVEEEYVKMLMSVRRHAEREVDMVVALNDFKAIVARFARSARIARTKGALLPDIMEFERRFKAVEESVHEFYGLGQKVKGCLKERVGAARVASITRAVERRHDAIKREWARIKTSAEETRAKLQDTQMRQHAGAKMAEAMRHVNELTHRVNTLQLSGKSVVVEQQELKEIQEEIEGLLHKKVQDIDALLSNLADKDGRFKRQRQELGTVVDGLEKLVKTRQQEAEAEGNITLFVGLIDKMDEQILQLSRLVESCAPHHARLVNQRFNKADLQSLLRTLVTGYREREPRVAELVETAKLEARKQFVDSERVVAKLDKTLERWAQVQSEAIARQRELQTCINQLDHEFFTKLAMAKSTSPKVSASSTAAVKPQATNSRQSPTPRAAAVAAAATTRARAASFRASKQPPTIRPSPAASTSRSRQPVGKYIADPNNELDVHLGKIVNESPYRIKVKMVRGQVGKYWFGDEQPRLVYCRILPSKMVMVRVGGGWVELSR